MTTTSVAVIGAGLAGAAAAWQLTRRGHEVTLLERAAPAHPLGSSHGSARIFRYAYPESLYAQLVVDARAEWNALEREAQTTLIAPTGAVDYGIEREPRLLAQVLSDVGVDNELLSADAASERWPGIAFSGDVLWHADAGVIDAEGAVLRMVELAERGGARVLRNWTATAVAPSGGGYAVTSDTGETVEAAQVVVAAGGWLPDLLRDLSLDSAALAAFPPLEVRQEQAFHFAYRDAERSWPTIIHKASEMQVYALPGGRDAGHRGQKVAEYNGGPRIASAAQHTPTIDLARRKRVIDYVRHNLPGLDPEPYAETTCLFTNTPREDFVIDRVGGITVLSPCSGHGAKFAPLIGELAARLVEERDGVPSRFRPLSLGARR